MAFVRQFEDKNIANLLSETLFTGPLGQDVVAKYSARPNPAAGTPRATSEKGDVFPAVREDRIDFYHRGGKLFSYWGNRDKGERFTTHHKYASVIEHNDKDDDYVNDKNLCAIGSFEKGYERIKQNCAHYAGDEAFGVSRIYEQFSCAKSTRQDSVVVLDIEVSLARAGGGSDRVDLLLFDTKSKLLRFFEAKLFSNSCLRSNGTPSVIGQMARYRKQMDTQKKCKELLDGYIEHVNVINKLFKLRPRLQMPETVDPEPRLLIFGFDSVQREHTLKKEVAKLKAHAAKKDPQWRLRVYCKGDIADVNPSTLFRRDHC